MKRNRAYRATDVKKVNVERLLAGREGQAVHVRFDLGKETLMAVTRKLALELYQVGAKGAAFDARLLFPSRQVVLPQAASTNRRGAAYRA